MANQRQAVVYDKSKYHAETVKKYGLPESHASHHTLVFFRWLIENNLMSNEFNSDQSPIEEFLSGRQGILSLYEWWDCCLVDNMLSDEGNAFAQDYFDFDKGQYLKDYMRVLQGNLPSEFHIEFTEDNFSRIKKVIDKRFKDWKMPRKWWWPF